MLDFVRVHQQLQEMVFDQKSVRRSHQEKVDIARKTLFDWSDHWEELVGKLDTSRTSWLLATDICEALNQRHPLPPRPRHVTAVATDGSQIFPDRHEFAVCHLINIGTVVLHYGSGERPILTSHPHLFYKDRDTFREWNGERIPVTEDMISALRGAFEIQELVRFSEAAALEKRTVVSMTDGTLILWMLASKPHEFRREILNFYLTSFEQFRQLSIPFMGYISQSTSADIINVLRVALCPENPVNCDQCPYKANREELPCEPVAGVTDATLFAAILHPGERSPIFKSSSEILSEYGPHSVYFCYLNVGAEVARIEMPKWVAQTPEYLNLVHTITYDQAQKGQGYPVSLAEAHEQAVIRGNERDQFFRMLEKLYVREGLQVTISRKSFKKRNVGV